MPSPTWLQYLRSLPTRRSPRAADRPPRRTRLAVEPLEDRAVPAAGVHDTSFSADGLANFDFNFGAGNDNRAHDAILQPDGKIVLVGSVRGPNDTNDFAVMRVNPDGSPDGTFGIGGLARVPFDGYNSTFPEATHDRAYAGALLPDGRIVVVGQTEDLFEQRSDAYGIAVLNPNGSLSTGFGVQGRATFLFNGIARDVVVQPDGKAVVVGNVDEGATGGNSIRVLRIDPSKRLDPADYTFGTSGSKVVAFNFGDTKSEYVTSAALQSDGKIVLTGSIDSVDTGDFDIAVIRLNSNGSLDNSFDGNGLRRVRLNYGGGNGEVGTKVLIQPDGKIVIPAAAEAGTSPRSFALAVLRLDSAGALDATFGTGGIRRIDLNLEDDSVEDGIVPAALQADGKIVLGATTVLGSGSTYYVARLTPDGSFDTGFATAGSRTVDFPVTDDNVLGSILIQADGKVVLAGYVDTPGGANDFAIARLEGANPLPSDDGPPEITNQPPLATGGSPDGRATTFTSTAGQYQPQSGALSPFGSVPTNVRPATADVNGDGSADTILVTGPGTPIRVAVINGADGSLLVQPFDPFGGGFPGGGFVTGADFDGDGKAEFVVTPDQGGGPRVSIFSLGENGQASLRANFLTIEANFRGGARAGAGDVNGDGVPDLVVSAGFQGGPRIVVLDGTKALAVRDFTADSDKLVGDFFAFSPELRNGAYVAVGDVDGDGFGDLVFGAGPGGGPEIRIASGQALLTTGSAAALSGALADFFLAGDLNNRGGVRVAVKDVDGDNKADVVAGTGGGQASFARVYLGKDFTSVAEPTTFQDLDPFGGAVLDDGVYVG